MYLTLCANDTKSVISLWESGIFRRHSYNESLIKILGTESLASLSKIVSHMLLHFAAQRGKPLRGALTGRREQKEAYAWISLDSTCVFPLLI
jgi:hypothetical protein